MKRVYRRSISEDLLSIKVYKLSLKPLSQRKGHYEQLIKLYCEENFYSQDLGKQIIDSFVWGLDLPLFISQECEELFVKARQGDAVAQNRLGICYYAGEGIEQDYVEAVKWFQKSAEQGDKWGQYHLAIHYANGNGIEQNYEEAVKWYQKAAEQGYCNAQNRLGVCYYNGDGIEQNYEEAVKWFQKSAEQGNCNAQYNLGNCYYNGQGVEQNYEEAVKWLRKSANQGNKDALAFLKEHGITIN